MIRCVYDWVRKSYLAGESTAPLEAEGSCYFAGLCTMLLARELPYSKLLWVTVMKQQKLNPRLACYEGKFPHHEVQ